MSTVPPLIVTLGGAMFTFPPGKEVTVGRGEASDVRIPDAGPGTKHVVSRLHLIIRVDPGVGQWVAIDKSRNGIFANRTRVPSAVISDDLTLAVGAPDGPQLHFRTATQVIPVAKFRPPPAHRPRAYRLAFYGTIRGHYGGVSMASTSRSRKRRRSAAGPVNSASMAGVSQTTRTISSNSSVDRVLAPLMRTRRTDPLSLPSVPVPTAHSPRGPPNATLTAKPSLAPSRATSA